MAISEQVKEKLRTLLVEMLLEFRREYLRTPSCKTLEHWRILLDRMRQASMQTGNADEWATKVQRRLQIPQLGNSGSSVLLDLSAHVREHGAWREMREVIERETGLLEALGRKCAEERKLAYEAKKEAAAT